MNKHVYTIIYSRKLTALLSVEYLGPLGNQSVTRTSGIKENILYSNFTQLIWLHYVVNRK